MKLGSNLDMNNDREPTITIIKTNIAELNNQIKNLSNDRYQHDLFNINKMNKPITIKKFNSNDYSKSDKPFKPALSNWWRDAALPGNLNVGNYGAWGLNLFPKDIAWWAGSMNGKPYTKYYEGDGTTSYFYYLYNAPSVMNVYIYTVLCDTVYLNGTHLNPMMSAVIPKTVNLAGRGAGFYGYELNTTLNAGKNVFEISRATGLPNSGHVFYIADRNKTVLFKSGDPDWGVTVNRVPDYRLINTNDTDRDNKSNAILEKIDDITELIQSTYPDEKDNKKYTNDNIAPFLRQFNNLKHTYAKLDEQLKKPLLLEGNYEISTIKVESRFSYYMLYIIFTLFIIGSLFIIFKNPEVGNLDTFILILAVMIIIYYIYEYIQMRKRK